MARSAFVLGLLLLTPPDLAIAQAGDAPRADLASGALKTRSAHYTAIRFRLDRTRAAQLPVPR